MSQSIFLIIEKLASTHIDELHVRIGGTFWTKQPAITPVDDCVSMIVAGPSHSRQSHLVDKLREFHSATDPDDPPQEIFAPFVLAIVEDNLQDVVLLLTLLELFGVQGLEASLLLLGEDPNPLSFGSG